MIILETRSEIKITVTKNWYEILRHPKMHPHTKFGISILNNIGDIHLTQCQQKDTTDVITNYTCMPPKVPFGGIKRAITESKFCG